MQETVLGFSRYGSDEGRAEEVQGEK